MLIVYKRIPADELRRSADEMVMKISRWFDDHPRRRVCNAQMWYGRQIKLKRKTFEAQVREFAEELIKEDESKQNIGSVRVRGYAMLVRALDGLSKRRRFWQGKEDQ